MQFSLRRLFYIVALCCLVMRAATLLPVCPEYPVSYSVVVFAIFGAIYYELVRAGVEPLTLPNS
jgi:hypothetical protein